MAYSLEERFPLPPKYYQIFDPGAYLNVSGYKFKQNKAPFLVKSPRVTQSCKLWTHSIYDANIPQKIPNPTSLMSKCPRFPYEAFSKEDLERLLCQCGLQDECECPVEEEEHEDITCQGNIPRCLFKGHPPRSMILGDSGLSAPSKRDNGFEISEDGSQRRNIDKVTDESPPFYDARVYESTEFYHGCKWSKWTTKRFTSSIATSPGPADYTIMTKPTFEQICYEKNRHLKRKASKQLRFIEMIQNLNIREGRPGPASYSPELPKSINTQHYGSKAKRFSSSKYEINPGPAEYTLKRVFDLPEVPEMPCHAKLPERACFGVKAQRFKPQKEEGASPASFDVNYKSCRFLHCPTAPFGSSSIRFKKPVPDYEDDDDLVAVNESKNNDDIEESSKQKCSIPTWGFKSKTIRMKPLIKRFHEPSPADLPQPNKKVIRLPELQYIAPFCTSEGRFEPWNDWMPVLGKMKTPGPAYYCLEKPRCIPAVTCGPLVRSPRFPTCKCSTPAPNEYNVGGGLEMILNTHNQRLKNNMENQHKFHWDPPKEPRKLTFEEQEMELLEKSILLLEVIDSSDKPSNPESPQKQIKSKFLRCFL
ncbi:uncharacterized protein LOC106133747 [Amyelois transitella]|uniref:uncharacterized protein LOC106133747 n=1 Tax=Amyelois transitella TaxID=680683 RepID=UPI00067DD831|nr:uncharacterized protein LOC106133747 [Amyelois transitella]